MAGRKMQRAKRRRALRHVFEERLPLPSGEWEGAQSGVVTSRVVRQQPQCSRMVSKMTRAWSPLARLEQFSRNVVRSVFRGGLFQIRALGLHLFYVFAVVAAVQ